MHARLFVLLILLSLTLAVAAQNSDKAKDATPPAGLRAPKPVTTPDADFPLDAHKDGICVVSVIIDKQGMPAAPRIIRCTDPVFEKNSLDCVARYRFKPATLSDGTAVAVRITVEINFRLGHPGSNAPETNPIPSNIRFDLNTPSGTTATGPDAKGVYPLTKLFGAPNSPPRMIAYSGTRFGLAAEALPEGVGCDVLITIDAKGKPADVQLVRCDHDQLNDAALDALTKSKYKSAVLDGNPVSVRALAHIAYQGFGAKQH